jgi:hypothetical protein
LGIAASSVSGIGRAAQSRADEMLAQNAFFDLSAKIDEACSLGPGNMRLLSLARGNATISANGSAIRFSSGKFSFERRFGCTISTASSLPSSEFRVENIDGKIEIT